MTTGALAVLAQPHWDRMHGWDGGWMWFWGTLMMLTWVAILGTVVWLVLRSTSHSGTSSRRAREILDERFAKGELNLEDYRERRDALR